MLTERFYKFLCQRLLYIISALVALSTAGLYYSIASTRLTNANFGGDGGDLLAAVLTRGIPHPTGYPTYILLGNLFQLIPLRTPVFRAALESLLPAALAAGLLSAWIGYVIGSNSGYALTAAALTGITWGVAPLVFSQAVIVEVHGLQSLIVVVVLWWITLNLDSIRQNQKKWLLGLSFLVGLGFGNHLTIIFLILPAFFGLVYWVRHSGSWRLALAQLALLMAGMSVYLYLPIRAQAYPAINWGNPQTWSGFLWEAGASPYHGLFLGAKVSVVWERVRSISSLFLDQFGALGLLAGAIGVVQYPLRVKWLRWMLACVFVVFLSFTIVYNAQDSAVYLIPSLMVFSIWIGLSVSVLWKLKWRQYPIGVFLVALLAISILIRIPETLQRVDPHTQDQPARYAEQLLKEAPLNAIVFTTSDHDSFPLWYYHFGLHQRPDLRIIVLPLTQFVWYQQTLVHIYPDLIFQPVYPQDLPNADWGKAIAKLNPQLAVCNTRLSAESQTGVSYQCSHP